MRKKTEYEVIVEGANILAKIEDCKRELAFLDKVKVTKESKRKKKELRNKIGVFQRHYIRLNSNWYKQNKNERNM